jgi:molybdopterin-containing oxidoreductase family membrane subunit
MGYDGNGHRVWGNNIPVAWGSYHQLLFWVGIGHAGTLISAILLLFRARWRNAISRFSEAMTIFAVICATLFPLIHIGRPWIFFWLMPYPNQRGMWPNFRSPLIWDVFAVNTYFLVSLLFWYLGLVPDLASLRDRAANKIRKFVYSMLSMGWRGAASHWRHYEKAYLVIAGLATGLVLSVHSVVSFDFAVSLMRAGI